MALEKIVSIGERINPYGSKATKELLKNRDLDGIQKLAIEQLGQGVDYIDVNVDTGEDQDVLKDLMADTVRKVQEVGLPLCIDSQDPELLKAGLQAYDSTKGLPIVNSVNKENYGSILELKKKYDFQIVFMLCGTELASDISGEKAYEMADELFSEAIRAGFKPDEVYFDPGLRPVTTLSPGMSYDRVLRILRYIKNGEKTKEAKTIIGLSNFGQGIAASKKSNREPLERAFLELAKEEGVDAIIGGDPAKYRVPVNPGFVQRLRNVVNAYQDGFGVNEWLDKVVDAYKKNIAPLVSN